MEEWRAAGLPLEERLARLGAHLREQERSEPHAAE
jgi:hypothetical protein